MQDLELWGGPECTVNRVGSRFRDQLVETGHAGRSSDLDLIASLGVTSVRYPILWERVAPDAPDVRDWRWSDERLGRLRALGLRPIAGLVHHGSGPRYTDLLDPGFATGLADHARAVAERYPWIIDWAPVNEPLTTARFAALYGHWYPHRRDEASFWTALINQIDAVRLAMRAIREVVPGARLIQTEDLGRTYATAAVRDQAAFDNGRRWMGWDLLCGRVAPDHATWGRHPFWERLCRFGLEDRLVALLDDPTPPDIIGVNHYLTSDRYLDHRVTLYPPATRGGNGARPFIDVEAVRVLDPPPGGLRTAIVDAWSRYGLPIAVTEVHNGCTRDEQLRWVEESWTTAQALRRDGIDVCAVTSWALFGSLGWNRLLTEDGLYEPGAWDVSSGTPRATALVGQLQRLAGRGPGRAVTGDGWWRRPVRLHHAPVPRPAPMRDHRRGGIAASAPLLILGNSGTLGGALAAACRHRDIDHVLTGRGEIDLTDRTSIDRALGRYRPWGVVNAAGYVRVDAAEADADACHRVNAEGAAALARACAANGVASVHFSSDLVFGGDAGRPYVEHDVPDPHCVYGASKAAAERLIGALDGTHLIVRTAAFFSPFDPHNFAIQVARALGAGERFAAACDQIVSPTYVPHLCDAVVDLLIDGADGIWHLTNGTAISWAEFGRAIADAAGLDRNLIDAVPGRATGWIAARPRAAALASARGVLMPTLTQAIAQFAGEIGRQGIGTPACAPAAVGPRSGSSMRVAQTG